MSFLTGGIRGVSEELVEGMSDPVAERDLLAESRGGLIGRCANPGCRSDGSNCFASVHVRCLKEGGTVRRSARRLGFNWLSGERLTE
jgi:hypothetical protein